MLKFSTWNTNMVLEARAVSCASPIVRSHSPMGIVASQYLSSRDAALVEHCFTPLISTWLNQMKINESANTVCNVAFHTSDCWNLKVIGIEGMVTRARLRYTQDYLMPGICSLIKPIAMEKSMPFPTKIHRVMLWLTFCHISPFICLIMNLLWLMNDKGTHIRFCWIPSHCGIDGNEGVDQLAKETLDHDIDPLVGVHYADLKPQVNSYI